MITTQQGGQELEVCYVSVAIPEDAGLLRVVCALDGDTTTEFLAHPHAFAFRFTLVDATKRKRELGFHASLEAS